MLQSHTVTSLSALLRTVGTVVAGLLRRVVAAARHATVAPSVSTKTGPTTCTTVHQGCKVGPLHVH